MTTDAIQAFADPSRRAILDTLLRGERAVSEVVAALGLSQPAVSQHLRVLLDAGLVSVRRDGRRRLYRPSSEGLEALRDEVERYWQGALTQMKHDLEPGESSDGTGASQ